MREREGEREREREGGRERAVPDLSVFLTEVD
jgi:hypothetical protein